MTYMKFQPDIPPAECMVNWLPCRQHILRGREFVDEKRLLIDARKAPVQCRETSHSVDFDLSPLAAPN